MHINDIINNVFSPKEVFLNENLFSFSYQINETEYFQIDLIKVAKAGYQKWLDNKAMYENLKVVNKIEMRLAKHQPKQRTSETVE